LSRSFESSGPDVKIRGTAQHIAEKYMALARDAIGSGDLVLGENYLQHAEHYNRIIMAAQPTTQQGFDGMNGNGQRVARPEGDLGAGDDMDGEDGEDSVGDGDQSAEAAPGYESQPRSFDNGAPRDHQQRDSQHRDHQQRDHQQREHQRDNGNHHQGGHYQNRNRDGRSFEPRGYDNRDNRHRDRNRDGRPYDSRNQGQGGPQGGYDRGSFDRGDRQGYQPRQNDFRSQPQPQPQFQPQAQSEQDRAVNGFSSQPAVVPVPVAEQPPAVFEQPNVISETSVTGTENLAAAPREARPRRRRARNDNVGAGRGFGGQTPSFIAGDQPREVADEPPRGSDDSGESSE
jgi:hypothetical protein